LKRHSLTNIDPQPLIRRVVDSVLLRYDGRQLAQRSPAVRPKPGGDATGAEAELAINVSLRAISLRDSGGPFNLKNAGSPRGVRFDARGLSGLFKQTVGLTPKAFGPLLGLLHLSALT
jgi:hypothetical protein